MDLAAVIGEKKAKRTYKRFTVPPAEKRAVPTAAMPGSLEFFYVGQRAENIDLLIRTFSSGYAAETVEKASFILSRLSQNRHNAPDVLIADASIGLRALASLQRMLGSFNNWQQCPFIVDCSEATEAEIKAYREASFVDEIIVLKAYSREGISTKINFLKKVKQRACQSQAAVELPAGLMQGRGNIFKRAFDILLSTLLLLLSSPLFLLIAIAIRLESKGPVFYISKRAGRGFYVFDFIKFRTMYCGSDSKVNELMHLNSYPQSYAVSGPLFIKINNDPRVTRVGAFLRRLSLDELPQLINVLKGDMSIVGNRPLPLYEAAALTTDQWAKRFMAPAGITGLWQIKKNRKQDMSSEERISLDCDYAEKSNFLYDLWIMAHTPSALIQHVNA